MKQLRNTILLMGAALVIAAPALAQEEARTEGLAIRALVGTSGQTAVLYGAEGYSYKAGSFYLGGAGSGGAFVGSNKGGMGYGGLIAGMADRLGGATYDLRVLVGGGGGMLNGKGDGGFAIEPSASLGVSLPGGWTPSLTVGYLYMPSVSDLSGATAGFRLNFPTK